MIFSDNFRQALEDYILLLNKKYPHKTILELIGTRYGLNHFERSMLYRGISPADKAKERQKRLIPAEKAAGEPLHIDLFNALFTVAAYLRGYPVYLSNDGILRDASESHGSTEWVEHLEKGLGLLVQFLVHIKPSKISFYIDRPLYEDKKIVKKLRLLSKEAGLEFKVISHDSPDHILEKTRTGVLASSDSTVIDRSMLPVFDLPRSVLKFHFEPEFMAIQ